MSYSRSLPRADLLDGDSVEETVDTGVDDRDLDLNRKRLAGKGWRQ